MLYRRGVFVLAGLVLVTGCSSGGNGGGSAAPTSTKEAAPAPKSAADVRALLAKNGLDCNEVEVVPVGKRAMGSENAVDFERCRLDGEQLNINIWKDQGQMDNWEGFAQKVGCAMGKQFGVGTLDWVKGDLWTIDDVTQTLADKIGAATGATPVHIKCE